VTYPADMASRARDLSYIDEFRYYVENNLFDFRLVDLGLFQFKWQARGDISYCYYQNPQEIPSYSEFLSEQLGPGFDNLDSVGDAFREEYDLVISTANLRESVTPIRYDLSPGLYECGVHPAAHLHIGMDNSIRIAVRRLMSPVSFVLFVLRQMYPDAWRHCLDRTDPRILVAEVRESLDEVEAMYFQDRDHLQLVLE
jgi:hypothetical protein